MLYLFGNQTQVGWLYVMSALLAGVVGLGFLLSRGSLRRLRLDRSLSSDSIYESDAVQVELALQRSRGLAAYQVELTETCPLAAPNDREQRLYAPLIPVRHPLIYAYPVLVDRRGVYSFPALAVRSGFPFGFFRRRAHISAPTSVMVYPEVRPLARFPLLEKQLAAQLSIMRAGHGGEILGVRPFRSGDSPRHVHWRSTARTGQLMSKEFADETQPGLTLILDTAFEGSTTTKHNPFEWAVKCAVSVADYGVRRGYPLRLLHGDARLPPFDHALVWDVVLQLMARIQPHPTNTAQLFSRAASGSLVVAVIPAPRPAHVAALTDLRGRGFPIMALLIDPISFGEADSKADDSYAALTANGIDALVIRGDEDYAAVLSQSTKVQGSSRAAAS
ncbi:MAG: DUF58 domain-containing protein [bacterium]|nr:DUF58 domain-containing protein [bacterium]